MLPSEIFQNFADANFGLQAKIIDQEEKLKIQLVPMPYFSENWG